MAIDAGVPIIPLIVWGAQRIVTKGGPKNLGRNHFPISVEVGAPIDPVEPAEALSEILRIEMDAILRHVQDGFVHEPGAYWVLVDSAVAHRRRRKLRPWTHRNARSGRAERDRRTGQAQWRCEPRPSYQP